MKAEFQDVLEHAEHTYALFGDSDRTRRHGWFHPAIRLAGWLTSKLNERQVTLNGEP